MFALLIAAAAFVGTLLTLLLIAVVLEWTRRGRNEQLARRIGRQRVGADRAFLARRIAAPEEILGPVGRRLNQEIHRSGLPVLPSQVLLAMGSLGAAGAVCLATVGVGPAALAALLGAALPVVGLRLAGERRSDHLARQIPEALDVMVSVLRSGGTVERALEQVPVDVGAPLGSELAFVNERVALGVGTGPALSVLADRNPDVPVLGRLVGFVALQQRTGGNLIRLLEQTRDGQLALLALREKMHAASSEARTTTGILLALPPIALLTIGALFPNYLTPLLEPGIGRLVFTTTAIWMVFGLYAMQRIARLGVS